MNRRLAVALAAAAISLVCVIPPAAADSFTQGSSPFGYTPSVPISAFARPASWFDPSRLHFTSTVSVGSGWNGQTAGLQVTRLSYAFGAPLQVGVSVGNTFGGKGTGTSFFLEGFDLTWRPSANSVFRVEMHDVRSPLQYQGWGRDYGDPFLRPY